MVSAACEFLAGQGFDLCAVVSSASYQAGEAVRSAWESFRAFANDWRQTLDPVIWAVASILALVPGTVALVKWRYYRRSQLQPRIEDFLKEEEERLSDAKERTVRMTARGALGASIGWRSPNRPIKYPIFAEPRLVRAMRQLGWIGGLRLGKLDQADRNISLALEKIALQKQRAEQYMAQHRRQELAALLLRGAIAASKASKIKNSADAVEENRKALSFFRNAREINPNDKQAIEYAAHQHRVLGELNEALEGYRSLQELAVGIDPEDAEVLARAWRYEGEILEAQHELTGVQQRLVDARQHLEHARDNIASSARDTLDHAAILEVLGRVLEKLGRSTLPARPYEQAEGIYTLLQEKREFRPEARAGLKRVRAALERIHGGTGPDDDGGGKAPADSVPDPTSRA